MHDSWVITLDIRTVIGPGAWRNTVRLWASLMIWASSERFMSTTNTRRDIEETLGRCSYSSTLFIHVPVHSLSAQCKPSPIHPTLPKPYILVNPVPPTLPPHLFSPLLLFKANLFVAGFPSGFLSRLHGGAFLFHEIAGLAHAVLFATAVVLADLVVDAGCGAPGAYGPVGAY